VRRPDSLPDANSRRILAAGERQDPDRLLTADDLAKRWQVPAPHVYRLARERKLTAVNLGRYRRFRLDAVEEFERNGGTGDG
jgi:excisionase family DNA binding protein